MPRESHLKGLPAYRTAGNKCVGGEGGAGWQGRMEGKRKGEEEAPDGEGHLLNFDSAVIILSIFIMVPRLFSEGF